MTGPTTGEVQPPAKNPCGTCPYRRDVPSGVWHPDEYAKLGAYDAETAQQPRKMFMCHQINGHVCGGWAACHDMTHSLAVRLAVIGGHITPGTVRALMYYTTEVPVFPTGQAAADHGTADCDEPSTAASRAINKITARRSRRNGKTHG